ncbi:hypothetical protein [Nonomuraea sp. NPDC052265]|uniref:hypothetical protein n=1 Tax=Nonomuraea sp. NPDC052265 TaxID=3364374 RepID=UPI0037CA6C4A
MYPSNDSWAEGRVAELAAREELTPQRSLDLLLELASHAGITVACWGRDTADQGLPEGRRLTDGEWERVRASGSWGDLSQEACSRVAASETIGNAIVEAGLDSPEGGSAGPSHRYFCTSKP